MWKFLFRRRARKARNFFSFSRKNSRAPFLVLPPCYANSHREVDETIVYDSGFWSFTSRCFFRAGLSRVNKGILRRSSSSFGQTENSRAETAFVNQVKAGRGSGDEDGSGPWRVQNAYNVAQAARSRLQLQNQDSEALL